MPTFATPGPIDVAVNLPVGRLDVVATDRTDTVVTVSPTNPDKPVDVRGAADTTVAFADGRLTVTAPKPRFSITGPSESIEIRVELPSGSRLTAETAAGSVRSTGILGATRVKASHVDLEHTGDLWLRAIHGNVEVGTADGNAEITADHGQIRVGTVTGDALLKASHGTVTIGEAGGEVDARLSYGDLEIGSALASVSGRTAYGAIRLREVSSGSIDLDSGYGQLTVGIREGVAAWLDVASEGGRVRNELAADSAPAATDQTVAVRARTQYGDILIQKGTKA